MSPERSAQIREAYHCGNVITHLNAFIGDLLQEQGNLHAKVNSASRQLQEQASLIKNLTHELQEAQSALRKTNGK